MPGNCRILVEFEESHVRLFLCNKAGKIMDEECFTMRVKDTPEDSWERAAVVHALIYDSLNYGINGRASSKENNTPE